MASLTQLITRASIEVPGEAVAVVGRRVVLPVLQYVAPLASVSHYAGLAAIHAGLAGGRTGPVVVVLVDAGAKGAGVGSETGQRVTGQALA